MPLINVEYKDWVIYKITNPNNAVYVGVTSNFKVRMRSYRSPSSKKPNTRLYSSLKKYGFSAHKVEILDQFYAKSEYAFEKEIYWIDLHNSNGLKYKNNGLNLTDGGKGTNGYTQSKETIKKLSKRPRWHHSEETKKRISEVKKGVPNTKCIGKKFNIKEADRLARSERAYLLGKKMVGRKMPESAKLKISMSKIGIPRAADVVMRMKETKTLKMGKPIIQYLKSGEFVQEFMSKREAHRITGVSRSTISQSLSGAIKNPYRFTFKYKE